MSPKSTWKLILNSALFCYLLLFIVLCFTAYCAIYVNVNLLHSLINFQRIFLLQNFQLQKYAALNIFHLSPFLKISILNLENLSSSKLRSCAGIRLIINSKFAVNSVKQFIIISIVDLSHSVSSHIVVLDLSSSIYLSFEIAIVISFPRRSKDSAREKWFSRITNPTIAG